MTQYGGAALTINFSLNEFKVSHSYPQLAEKISFSPVEIERLRFACAAILEPLRGHYDKPVRILSGKRCTLLNQRVGGHPHSHHLFADDKGAVDIYIPNFDPREAARWLVENCQVAYVIAYINRSFLHVSFPCADGITNRLFIDRTER
jgi:zinc D-Ala-D-Ala carboxypeptidase